MRTKTILLSAAALVAGLISSQAQNVYSVNVVGYYNLPTPVGSPGNSKSHLIANQLLGSGGSNDVNVVLQAGLDDSTSQGVDLALWNGSGFTVFTYYGPIDSGGVPGFYDGGGNFCTNKLSQGIGAFLINYSGKAITNTLVGDVRQGNVTNHIAVGSAPYGLNVPVSTNMVAPFVQLIPASQLDNYSQSADYFHWNVGAQSFDAALTWYGPIDAGNATGGWYDGLGNDHTFDPAFFPAVGEGFFLNVYNGKPAYDWVATFTVQ